VSIIIIRNSLAKRVKINPDYEEQKGATLVKKGQDTKKDKRPCHALHALFIKALFQCI
jgi:hypothetical protein